MGWQKSCFLAASAAVLACSPASPPARTVAPSAARPPVAAAPWPDVARDAPSEKGGARDAAVVVAVERRATLADLRGVRVSGEDWARFFPNVLGVPPDRVTALFDASATRSAVSSALRDAAAKVAPGGRLWFVAIGYAVVGEADIAPAADRSGAQLVSVLDVVLEGAAELGRPARAPTRPGALPPITFPSAGFPALPGASRPALSYLLMGALRGWADRDHDHRVTASEAAAYVDITLRYLSSPGNSRRSVNASADLACSELSTLSVALEPAPNVTEIAPRVPLGPHANPEHLAAALEAVRAADTQLALARASGSLKATAERDMPQLTGEGATRRVEVVAMPPEVELTLRVRLEQAKRLGGPAVREAAPLLVEAGRLLLAYGWLDESKQVLTAVLEARCGADAVGHQAWESLWSVANWAGDSKGAARLMSMNCAYDEASATAIDDLLRPIRGLDGPNERARQLLGRAEQESDATLARCTWSAVAEKYAQSWWSDPEHFWQAEAALNGAYAFSTLGRTDVAAALYRAYLRLHAGARAGESGSDAEARRSYAVLACTSYLAIARAEPRHFPGYFDACRNVGCAGIDRASCAKIIADVQLPLLGSLSGLPERARQLSLAAHDREELAGWELSETARTDRLREASERYASAEAAWAAIVELGDATPDPAEAARRLAEAALRRVVVGLEAFDEVTEKSIENARQLARRARDISAGDRRVEPTRLLVDLADGLLAREQRAFGTSHGERGVAPRSEVRFEGEGDGRHFMRDEIPVAVRAAIAARDEYLASVPATFDVAGVRYRMAYEAGRLEFVYGHFAEARQHLELPYAMQCGLSPLAHEAWLLLLSMANLQLDVPRAHSLAADAAVCPFDVETRIVADRMRKPVFSVPFFLEGRRQLQASEALPNGPQRRALRREAAAIFRQFVDESPAREEAAESAQLAAELYAELHEDARALEMYRLFVERYGAQTRVRVADLEKAYAALAMLHARLGDYRAAARMYVEESEQKRLSAKARAAAARKARELRRDREGRGLQSASTVGG